MGNGVPVYPKGFSSMDGYEKYREFGRKLGEVLRLAKPNMDCYFEVFEQGDVDSAGEYARDMRGNSLWVGDWYVVVACDNDYRYYINVSGDSLATIGEEVFKYMVYK